MDALHEISLWLLGVTIFWWSKRENINPNSLKDRPLNISLKEAPAPATKHLEDNYYIDVNEIIEKLEKSFQFAS